MPQPDSVSAKSNKAKLRFMHSIPMSDRVDDQESDEASPEDGDYSPPLAAHIPDAMAGLRLDQALAKLFPQHSRSRMQGWVGEGRILLDGTAAKDVKQKVWGSE